MPPKVFFRKLELLVMDSVYEPREDSFLLAEALHSLSGARVLDLGCGTGLQGLNAAQQGATEIVFADQNPVALKNARQNCALNAIKTVSFVQSDLFSNLPKNKRFDCIIFNPPYVPTDSKKKWLETDGGKRGREVLDCFLDECKAFLKSAGTVFFVQSSLNGIQETKKRLCHNGFVFQIVARKKLFFEALVVFKAQKK